MSSHTGVHLSIVTEVKVAKCCERCSLSIVIIQVSVVLKRTVGDSD